MDIYKIERVGPSGDDDYNSHAGEYFAVVIAESEDEARHIQPGGDIGFMLEYWVPPDKVSVTPIGVAYQHIKKGVVIASFNAG